MSKFIQNSLSWVFRRLNLLTNLTAENLALRHQLVVLSRNQKQPALNNRDRMFWIFLSRFWSGWRKAVVIVQPDTVVRWHKSAFKPYWRRKSRGGKRGRPPLDPEVKAIVLRMANSNPTWAAPKVHGELLKLGLVTSE